MTQVMNSQHKQYIEMAINIAKESGIEIPVAAIIVKDGQIIASAYNQKEKNNDVTAHAEILAIRQASEKLGRWRLEHTVMYVTLEPCPMCAAAIIYSRIGAIYFGAYDTVYGAFSSSVDMRSIIKSDIKVLGGIEEEKCSLLMKDFFEAKR